MDHLSACPLTEPNLAWSFLKAREILEQVAQTFFMDPSIEQACKLDAIITVVDGDTSAYMQSHRKATEAARPQCYR